MSCFSFLQQRKRAGVGAPSSSWCSANQLCLLQQLLPKRYSSRLLVISAAAATAVGQTGAGMEYLRKSNFHDDLLLELQIRRVCLFFSLVHLSLAPRTLNPPLLRRGHSPQLVTCEWPPPEPNQCGPRKGTTSNTSSASPPAAAAAPMPSSASAGRGAAAGGAAPASSEVALSEAPPLSMPKACVDRCEKMQQESKLAYRVVTWVCFGGAILLVALLAVQSYGPPLLFWAWTRCLACW